MLCTIIPFNEVTSVPKRIVSDIDTRVGLLIRRLLTKVPFVDPKSLITPVVPVSSSDNTAWEEDTVSFVNTHSFVRDRPIVIVLISTIIMLTKAIAAVYWLIPVPNKMILKKEIKKARVSQHIANPVVKALALPTIRNKQCLCPRIRHISNKGWYMSKHRTWGICFN